MIKCKTGVCIVKKSFILILLLLSVSLLIAKDIHLEPVLVIDDQILDGPHIVAFDPGFERVLIVDESNYVHVYDLNGEFIFKFGGHGDENYQFESISGISVLGTNYIVGDSYFNKICYFDTSGNFLSKFDLEWSPGNLRTDEDNYLYVSNVYDLTIEIINEFQNVIKKISLPDGYGKEEVIDIEIIGVSWEDDYVFIGDNINDKIISYDKDGRFEYEFSSEKFSENSFLSICYADKFIFVTCENDNSINVFDKKGKLNFSIGKKGINYGEFAFPMGIALFADEELLAVADYGNNRVQIFDISGLNY